MTSRREGEEGEGEGQRAATTRVAKIVEIVGTSNKSWEDAAQGAVTTASKSVRNIKSIYIENMEATVSNGKIERYRVNAKLSFVLED